MLAGSIALYEAALTSGARQDGFWAWRITFLFKNLPQRRLHVRPVSQLEYRD
jgi:hypothetical protein